jgi:hypothetical protein
LIERISELFIEVVCQVVELEHEGKRVEQVIWEEAVHQLVERFGVMVALGEIPWGVDVGEKKFTRGAIALTRKKVRMGTCKAFGLEGSEAFQLRRKFLPGDALAAGVWVGD